MSRLYRCARASLWLALAASSCARVVHRAPPSGAGGPAAEPALQIDLPEGAVCAQPDRARAPDLQDGVCAPGAADSWPVWTAQTPAGLCYELGARCPDLEDHVAYLTFDDGPSDWTAAILDILASRQVHATFFVNARGLKGAAGLDGSYVADSGETVHYRDLIKRVVDEGHALGNHTRDHPDLGAIEPEEIRAQLQDNERLVNVALVQAGGTPRPLSLLRPPFGSPWQEGKTPLDDPAGRRAAAGAVFMQYGYNVLWNITSTDAAEWAQGEAYSKLELARVSWTSTVGYAEKVERIRSHVVEDELVREGAGIVVLMHDSHNATRDALAGMIDDLRARGYRFETIEEQVQKQYGRPSLALLPGPALSSTCGSERLRSCLELGTAPGLSVCGRLWRAYTALGGRAALGLPRSAPEHAPDGAISQRFERGTIELHPEQAEPCDSVLLPAH